MVKIRQGNVPAAPAIRRSSHLVAGLLTTIGILAMIGKAAALEPLEEAAGADVEAERLETVAYVSPHLKTTGALELVRAHARESAVVIPTPDDVEGERSLVEFTDERPAVIEDIIDLECLPLFELSDDDADHRVVFGISFGGVLGLHGSF